MKSEESIVFAITRYGWMKVGKKCIYNEKETTHGIIDCDKVNTDDIFVMSNIYFIYIDKIW